MAATMKEILEADGWVMYYTCSRCGHKQWFVKKDKTNYEIRARAKDNVFSIVYNNQTIAGPFWGYMLADKLKQYIK